MSIYRHAVQQPFVLATGVAALIHSTWSLGTLFAGEQPENLLHLAGWLIPAFLIAFALDVGQIVTSADIRAHGLTWQRGLAFGVFALATYYLQWLYIAHHMPLLELASGVREQWSGFATVLRDAAIWIIPALLPLSTLLYTFSSEQSERVEDWYTVKGEPYEVLQNDTPELSEPVEHAAECPSCGWTKEYTTATSAVKGLAAHKQHCKALHPELLEITSNGHVEGEGIE